MLKRNANKIKTAASPKPTVAGPNIIRTKSHGIMKRRAATMSGGSVGGFSSAQTGAIQSVAQSPLYYDYRYSTPDKYYFPRNRVVANSIWRSIYLRDPAIATATDMYAELPWSEFDLVGIDDASIKRRYEDMFNDLNLVPKLQPFTRDYFITGELILHAIFNGTKGYWDRVIPHDPDYIKVDGVPLVAEQPLLSLLPTPEIKRLLAATDPRMRKLQAIIPREIRNAFRMGREVPLDALNTTFLPRLNSSTEIRGTSLYTRLFRIVMYEDFIVNASLAVAQRNAVPLRIFKLGDPTTGWLPDEDDEAAFSEMLSIAESDPLAAIVMHHNVSVELVGVSDRMLLISKEWDFIERVKLLALGVAKSFLVGETSFAAAIAGLQTLLERLSALRNKFEKQWMVDKLCKPVGEMNDFYKIPQAHLDHRIRIKDKDKQELIIPKVKWRKSLDPTQDPAILGVWRDLKAQGMLSERSYSSGAGVDLDVERRNQIEEAKYRLEHPEIYGPPPEANPPAGGALPGGPAGAKPPGGAAKPPAGGGVPMPPAPGGGGLSGAPGASDHKIKRYSTHNPYVIAALKDSIEEELDQYINTDNLIHVDDVKDAIDDALHNNSALDEKLTAAEAEYQIPPVTSAFLSGEPSGE